MADVRRRVGQPARVDPRCWRRRCTTPTRAFDVAQRRVPADARVRARDPARRRGDAGDDRRRVPVDRRRRASSSAQTSSAGSPRSSRRPRADLAKLIDRAEELLPQTDLASKCVRDVVLPTGDVVVNDEFTTGVENYKEFFYALVGLAGEGQNTDGNGMYVRFQVGGGSQTVSLGSKTLEHRPAVRQQRRGAARQPAGLPGQAPALQARLPLLQEHAAGRQRPGRGEVAADRRAGDHRARVHDRARQAAPPGRPRGRAREAQPVRAQEPAEQAK